MKTKTQENIISYIKAHGPQRPSDLCLVFGISPQALHAQMRKAVAARSLQRIGKPPRTRYEIPPPPTIRPALDEQETSIL